MPDSVAVVVGGTGFVGRRICAELASAGIAVRRASRTSDDLRLDLSDRGSVERQWAEVASDVTHVVASVGSATPGQSLSSLAVHIQGVEHLTSLLRTSPRLERVVLVSSMLAYGDADTRGRLAGRHFQQSFASLYGYAKYRSESIFEQARLPTRYVRPGLVLGDAHSGGVDRGQVADQLVHHALSLPLLPIEQGGNFPLWTVPVDAVARDVCHAAVDADAQEVLVSADPASGTLVELLQALLRPFGRVPLIVDLGRRLTRSSLMDALLRRAGVTPEWSALARPWATIDIDDLVANRTTAPAIVPGYVDATASAIGRTFAVGARRG